jgi:hypothetical protein
MSAFEGLAVTTEPVETVVDGPLADQQAVHGLLIKLESLEQPDPGQHAGHRRSPCAHLADPRPPPRRLSLLSRRYGAAAITRHR